MSTDLKNVFDKTGKLDQKSVEFLTKAFEKQSGKNFDYIKFKQSLAALSAMNVENEMAFKSAFATAATMGLSKDALLKSAEQYKVVLDREKNQFDAALVKQINQRVGAKRTKVKQMKEKVKEYQNKIAELEKRIGEFEQKISASDQEINQSTKKIEQTKDRFEKTYQKFKSFIDEDIIQIQKFL